MKKLKQTELFFQNVIKRSHKDFIAKQDCHYLTNCLLYCNLYKHYFSLRCLKFRKKKYLGVIFKKKPLLTLGVTKTTESSFYVRHVHDTPPTHTHILIQNTPAVLWDVASVKACRTHWTCHIAGEMIHGTVARMCLYK